MMPYANFKLLNMVLKLNYIPISLFQEMKDERWNNYAYNISKR